MDGTTRGVQVTAMPPSQQMRELGIIQSDSHLLDQPARPFNLPAEADVARTDIDQIRAAMHRIRQVHPFAKGMGLAGPQIGIHRAVAAVQSTDGGLVVLLNPQITAGSDTTDLQYEGCLSFFDVRGLVQRPLQITVEVSTLDGELTRSVYRQGLARLVHHEIDHLFCILYTAHMQQGLEPIPVEQYRQTGQAWTYES
jgi:peptide deformylase